MNVKGFPVEDEYKKKTGIIPQDVATLREWLKSQPHLPERHITDLDLILAFNSCKRSFEVTKQVVDMHYTLNTLFAGYFDNRKYDSKVEEMCNNILFVPLPTRTAGGDAIMYMRVLNLDVKAFNIESWLRGYFMLLDFWQYREGTWPGLQVIVDFDGLGLGHITKIDVQNMRQCLYYLQEAMFVTLSGLHYINAPGCVDVLLSMIKPFMNKDLLKIFHVHSVGSNTLDQFVPIAALPKESGGKYDKTYEECKNDLKDMYRNSADFFEQDNLKKVNEALRPGKQKTISDIFGGVEGSFKKLDID